MYYRVNMKDYKEKFCWKYVKLRKFKFLKAFFESDFIFPLIIYS